MINNVNSVSRNDNENGSSSTSISSLSTNSYFANMTSNIMTISDDTNINDANTSSKNLPPVHSSVAIQMDSEKNRTVSTISIKRNINNFFEIKDKLGT